MRIQLAHAAAALLISAAGAACAAPVNALVDVTLTGWAFGNGAKVKTNASTPLGTLDYRGHAGAFTGTLAGAGELDSAALITWCIELEERVTFDRLVHYSLVAGADYFDQRRGDAGIAERLGRLLTFAADNASLVDNKGGSAALQLAVWNIVYDTDWSVGGGGNFSDASNYGTAASALLAGAEGVASSRYDVFALEHAGSQDLLAASLRAQANGVPEPGSLALAGSALLGLLLARRRRARA